MVTPYKLKQTAMTLDALMEAFEMAYLHFIDIGNDEMDQRNKGCAAYYGIREILEKLIVEMNELEGHMEVCDVVLASRLARGEKVAGYGN